MFQLTLRRRGISDQAVLRAMEEVPRDQFVDDADRDGAYRDSALPIACGQTISQPFVVAYMTEQLQLQKKHRVLEIGAGSGYQAAVLSRLAGQVLTVERYRKLADAARIRLEKLNYHNVEVMLGDGLNLPPNIGPFDDGAASGESSRAAGGGRHPDRARRPPSGRADADPAEPDRSRDRAQGTRRGPVRAGAARCGAGAVEFRIGCAANILLGGLSRYLLGACLLKTPVLLRTSE